MNAQGKATSVAGAKVLIADDEPEIRYLLTQLAERLGCKAIAAADGMEALELYYKYKPDLVILDVYMPRMNGLTVLSRIRETNPNCQVIVITGVLHYEQLAKINSVRPNAFLSKPLSSLKTAILITQLLQHRHISGQTEIPQASVAVDEPDPSAS